MKKTCAVALFLFSLSTWADSERDQDPVDLDPTVAVAGAQERLPIVSADQLQVGQHWTWTYYEQGDLSRPYSSERYEVVEVQGSRVLFEMRSRYDDHSELKPHHRFRVDLRDCFHAFDHPQVKQTFMIDLYPLEDGQWVTTPVRSEATAFEEKFNCNPVRHSGSGSMYETRFDVLETAWGKATLFQQWPKAQSSQLRSFYFMDHPGLKGVAYRKAFNPGTAAFYEMRLVEWGT